MRRPLLAKLALAVWLLGFEIGPDLHVAFHELLEEHDHDHDPDDDDDDDHDADHGDGSIEHHQLASLPAVLLIVVPPPRLAEPFSPPVAPDRPVRSARPTNVRSRAPPLSS